MEQTFSTSSLVTLSIYLQKINWTVNGPKSFMQHLCNFCSHTLTFFSILLPQTKYVFPHPQTPTCLCGYYWPSWPFLPLINKIKPTISPNSSFENEEGWQVIEDNNQVQRSTRQQWGPKVTHFSMKCSKGYNIYIYPVLLPKERGKHIFSLNTS